MSLHELRRAQDLAVDTATAWDFLATPRNLDRITPPDLHFTILSGLPERMYAGQLIRYHVGIPFFGRWDWLTEIRHLDPGRSFVDECRHGPYSLWYHEHRLEALDDGRTRMHDHVTYRLPGGILGDILHALHVRGQLRHIFAHRSRVLQEIFPGSDPARDA